jgi:hypothetical protein
MAKFHEIEPNYVVWHCPGCDTNHMVAVNGKKMENGAGWQWNGSFDSPTLAPSVLYNVGRSNPTEHLCHSLVKDGQMQFLDDCTHTMKGKTVAIPEWDDY